MPFHGEASRSLKRIDILAFQAKVQRTIVHFGSRRTGRLDVSHPIGNRTPDAGWAPALRDIYACWRCVHRRSDFGLTRMQCLYSTSFGPPHVLANSRQNIGQLHTSRIIPASILSRLPRDAYPISGRPHDYIAFDCDIKMLLIFPVKDWSCPALCSPPGPRLSPTWETSLRRSKCRS